MSFRHNPHPRIQERKQPTADRLNFNDHLAVVITAAVGTMWCAYLFAALALGVLPEVVHTPLLLVQWISQTFLQLVMLSILMVGQSIQNRAADRRAIGTFADTEAILHELLEVQKHLVTQDIAISYLLKQSTRI